MLTNLKQNIENIKKEFGVSNELLVKEITAPKRGDT